MKRFFQSLICLVPLTAFADDPAVIFEADSQSADPHLPVRIIWESVPGIRYDLLYSSNLRDWTRMDGFPKSTTRQAFRQTLAESPDEQFFQVVPLDEQAPEIVERFPNDGMQAINPAATVFIELSDASGIDATSVQLAIGAGGTLTQGSPGLSISGNSIIYDPGGSPLGAAGETISVSLTVADTVGNSTTETWSFNLLPEPVLESNIFVFGSAAAQPSGQQLPPEVAGLAAAPPAVPKDGPGDPWQLISVEEDRIVISYDSTPPAFADGALLCNAAPEDVDGAFYRSLLSVVDDPQTQQLTLLTEEASLEDFVIEGASSVSAETVLVEFDEEGLVADSSPMTGSTSWTIPLPALGLSVEDQALPAPPGATLTLTELRWILQPEMWVALAFENNKLIYFESNLEGVMKSSIGAELTYSGSAQFSGTVNLLELLGRKSLRKRLLRTQIGVVPVWLDLEFRLNADYEASASAEAILTGGFRHEIKTGINVRWNQGDDEPVWTPFWKETAPARLSRQFLINGAASARISLVPELALVINRLADLHINIDPTYRFEGQREFNAEDNSVAAEWLIERSANLNAGFSILGSTVSRDFPVKQLLYDSKTIVEPKPPLRIERHPADFYPNVFGNVATNGSQGFLLQVDAVGPDGENDPPITYQWYHWGIPIPGKTQSSLDVPRAGGPYYVDVIQGLSKRRSETINFFYLSDN